MSWTGPLPKIATPASLPDPSRRAETALYRPVKAFLERQGYAVKGEICCCDLVAVRGDEPPLLVIAEFKLGLNLELLLQAVDRMSAADAVWLAVPRTRRGRDRDTRATRLCKLLGIGLLTVGLSDGIVEVAAEATGYAPRADLRRRKRLLLEHRRRQGDPAEGGSTRTPIMTAYRQRALACAGALRAGEQKVRALRPLAEDAGQILLRNVYGWFERAGRGVYRLSATGEAALLALPTPPPGPEFPSAGAVAPARSPLSAGPPPVPHP